MMKKFLLAILTVALLSATATAAPLIGVNMNVQGTDWDSGRFDLGSRYIDAVTSAGGIPVILPPVMDDASLARYVEMCDGFLMTGGRDISPALYGVDEVHPEAEIMNPRREAFDFRLIRAVLEADKPLLGVCLGSQEINVALGGSMVQDIPSETSTTINHKPGNGRIGAHTVDITTGSLLHDIVSTTTLSVNSIHHQACDRLGSGVLVMARAPDGIVESYAVEEKDFVLGVQWHPEALTEYPEQLSIYQALIRAAQLSRAQREQ